MLRFHQSQQRNDGVEGSSSDGRMNNKPKGDGDGASKGMFLDNYGEHKSAFVASTRSR